jgi:putative transcriptional regulator
MSKTTISRATSAEADLRPLRPMTEAEVLDAANSDPDAKPFTAAQLARLKHTPRARLIRRAFGLSEEDFAARFHIPLATLRNWESGAVNPDAVANAYLTVIAVDPEGVSNALGAPEGRGSPSGGSA